jgi:hypothetical protein
MQDFFPRAQVATPQKPALSKAAEWGVRPGNQSTEAQEQAPDR